MIAISYRGLERGGEGEGKKEERAEKYRLDFRLKDYTNFEY